MDNSNDGDIFDTGLKVNSHCDLLRQLRDIDTHVGPPRRRTKEQRERFCIVHFLLLLPASLLPSFPISIIRYDKKQAQQSAMDFKIAGTCSTVGIEISEATDQDLKRIDSIVSREAPGKVWDSSQLDSVRSIKGNENIVKHVNPQKVVSYTLDSEKSINELNDCLNKCVNDNLNKISAQANLSFNQKWLVCYPHTSHNPFSDQRPEVNRMIDGLRSSWWNSAPMFDLIGVLFDESVFVVSQRSVNHYSHE
ncbi:hypothetical protein KKH27_02535 [bacterium]|nr:hypothetical protein [bacterium]MBU1982879.1 hypothetical protein [bacterium]